MLTMLVRFVIVYYQVSGNQFLQELHFLRDIAILIRVYHPILNDAT